MVHLWQYSDDNAEMHVATRDKLVDSTCVSRVLTYMQ